MSAPTYSRTPAVPRRGPPALGPRTLGALALFAAIVALLPTGISVGTGAGPGAVHSLRIPVVPGPPPATIRPTSFPTPIHHVFTIFLENEELSSVTRNAPFEVKLAQEYASASNYYSVCHPSAPNYLAVTSGATWQCGSDAVRSHATENLGDLAQKAGLTWSGFFESMPSSCDRSDAYPYIAHHNPFVYYPDVYGNTSRCRAHDQSFTAWSQDVTAGRIPAYAFFAPNMTNDGHDTSTSYADRWLDRWISPFLNASWFSSTVWFVTWDEGTSSSGCCGFTGGHLFFTAVSPYTRGGRVVATNATHYSLLSTTEWLLGLPVGACGHADNSSAYAPLKGLFNFSTPPTTNFSLHGIVSSAGDGRPLVGANVTLGTGAWSLTDAAGDYSFEVANGSYLVTATASGFLAQSTTVMVSGASAVQDFALVAATAPEYPVVGTVTYAFNGSSATAASVNLVGGASTWTNSSGGFALTAPNGSYALTAWQSGFTVARATVTVAGATVVQNFSLRPFLWNQTGTALDATTGAPVAGALVSVAIGPVGIQRSNVTGSMGEFRLTLSNGSYFLTLAANLYRTGTEPLSVRGSPTPVRVLLVRVAPVYAVSGHVQFGNGSLAPAGVELRLNSSRVGVTDRNGSFAWWSSNGSYLLDARSAGWYSTPVPIIVVGRPLSRILTLVPFTFPLSGTVRFANGSPVGGAVISLTPLNSSTITAPDGRFVLNVPNGTYSLAVIVGGTTVARTTVVVDGGASVHDVSLPSATGTASAPSGLAPILLVALVGAVVISLAARWRRFRRVRPPTSPYDSPT
ncbi:MAG: carboxypeptidase regulatory-like domain-containing protein [Thermoplasmata archaeon]|nr:carboxypeptidase regulatory-like domain-containing protein [Thermoplasmata archaeon]